MRVRLPFIIIVLIIGVHFCCQRQVNFSYNIHSIDSTTNPQKVSINYLANNFGKFHSKYIQTEGTYYIGFEHFVIVADGPVFSNNRFAFWLDTNDDLIPENDWPFIVKANGQRVIIKEKLIPQVMAIWGNILQRLKTYFLLKQNKLKVEDLDTAAITNAKMYNSIKIFLMPLPIEK